MSDLSSVVASDLERLQNEILELRRGRSRERDKPHKLLMLLAVLDLADDGELEDNRVYFDDRLITRFENYFHLISKGDDWCQPAPPFFHLRFSTFWFHKVKPGRDAEYASLTTSGGGTKRIHENIEYAYLSEDAFSVIRSADARKQLRRFVSALLNESSPPMSPKIGTVFHETFSLSRPALSQVLASVSNYPDKVELSSATQREAFLRSKTNLGTRYVKAMPRYGLAAGLLRPDTYRLTHFGVKVAKQDPSLERLATLWLLHYYMSVPHGLAPGFWNELVFTQFVPGNKFSRREIETQISSFVTRTEGKILGDRSVGPTATAFLGTYTKSDGLEKLGLIEESPSRSDNYIVLEPDPPSVWAFGIALLDYWQTHYAGRAGIHLDELSADRGLGPLFMMGPGRINAYLRDLQDEGYVEIYRVAPPYRLMLLRQDPEPLWQKLYAPDIAD